MYKHIRAYCLINTKNLPLWCLSYQTCPTDHRVKGIRVSPHCLYRMNALDLWTGALTLATSSLLWKQQWNSWHLLRNNEHIFPDFMKITVWIWMKLMSKLTLYFVHNVCKWQEFSCFHTAVEVIFSAVCDHFWTKTSFSTSLFWGSNYHFLDDLDYLLCNVWVSFWFYPIEIHFF